MREDRISLRRSNVSRGNKTTVQLQNLLQPHRMTLPVKCLWQQQLFISDSYRFPNWFGMFTSLHPPILTQTQQNGSKKLTWLCQVLHVQSFLGCFFLPFHFPFNSGGFHQPSSTRSTCALPMCCARWRNCNASTPRRRPSNSVASKGFQLPEVFVWRFGGLALHMT